jgi:hypothetical protein
MTTENRKRKLTGELELRQPQPRRPEPQRPQPQMEELLQMEKLLQMVQPYLQNMKNSYQEAAIQDIEANLEIIIRSALPYLVTYQGDPLDLLKNTLSGYCKIQGWSEQSTAQQEQRGIEEKAESEETESDVEPDHEIPETLWSNFNKNGTLEDNYKEIRFRANGEQKKLDRLYASYEDGCLDAYRREEAKEAKKKTYQDEKKKFDRACAAIFCNQKREVFEGLNIKSKEVDLHLTPCSTKHNLLSLAILCKSRDAIKFLLDKGASIYRIVGHSSPIILYAMRGKHSDMFQILLDNIEEIELSEVIKKSHRDAEGRRNLESFLHFAAKNNHCLEALLAKKPYSTFVSALLDEENLNRAHPDWLRRMREKEKEWYNYRGFNPTEKMRNKPNGLPKDSAPDAALPPAALTDAALPPAALTDAALPPAALTDAALPPAALTDAALPPAALPPAALPPAALTDAALPPAALPPAALTDAALPPAALPPAALTDAALPPAASTAAALLLLKVGIFHARPVQKGPELRGDGALQPSISERQ